MSTEMMEKSTMKPDRDNPPTSLRRIRKEALEREKAREADLDADIELFGVEVKPEMREALKGVDVLERRRMLAYIADGMPVARTDEEQLARIHQATTVEVKDDLTTIFNVTDDGEKRWSYFTAGLATNDQWVRREVKDFKPGNVVLFLESDASLLTVGGAFCFKVQEPPESLVQNGEEIWGVKVKGLRIVKPEPHVSKSRRSGTGHKMCCPRCQLAWPITKEKPEPKELAAFLMHWSAAHSLPFH